MAFCRSEHRTVVRSLRLTVDEGVVAAATFVDVGTTIEIVVDTVVGVRSCACCGASMEMVVTDPTAEDVGTVTP